MRRLKLIMVILVAIMLIFNSTIAFSDEKVEASEDVHFANPIPETSSAIEPAQSADVTPSTEIVNEQYISATQSPESTYAPEPTPTVEAEPSADATPSTEIVDEQRISATQSPESTCAPESTPTMEPTATLVPTQTDKPCEDSLSAILTTGITSVMDSTAMNSIDVTQANSEPAMQTYTITIPAGIELDDETYTGQTTISANLSGESQKIDVFVSSRNNFALCSENDTVSYVLCVGNSQEALQNGASVTSFTESSTCTLNIKVTDAPEKYGRYTDVLTFTVVTE